MLKILQLYYTRQGIILLKGFQDLKWNPIPQFVEYIVMDMLSNAYEVHHHTIIPLLESYMSKTKVDSSLKSTVFRKRTKFLSIVPTDIKNPLFRPQTSVSYSRGMPDIIIYIWKVFVILKNNFCQINLQKLQTVFCIINEKTPYRYLYETDCINRY